MTEISRANEQGEILCTYSESKVWGDVATPDGTFTVTASKPDGGGPVAFKCTCGLAEGDDLCPHTATFIMDNAPVAFQALISTNWAVQCVAPLCSFCGKVYDTYAEAKIIEGKHPAAAICGECREQIRQADDG